MENHKLAVVSWSGGKDCSLACYRALSQGHKVAYLVNFISEEHQRVRFHGTEAAVIRAQSEAAGIPLLQRGTPDDGYERVFKDAVRSLLPQGIGAMVFGDIYTDEHREWVERVCREIGIEAIEPLWGEPVEKVVTEFISAGFEAVVVSAKADLIEERWVGHRVDADFVAYLKDRRIDLCGENGEYHTLVINGPFFKRRIEITRSRTINRDRHWLLDILGYELRDRT